jgi:hypothetical protein
MSDYIEKDETHDGIDRRGFLKCMAWAGTGLVWGMKGGILTARAFGAEAAAEKLKSYLGLTRVDVVQHTGMLATTDTTLADDTSAAQP